jgi:predicted transcriptional regulator
MKSVLISIQPKWVEKIVNKEKTIEVRKSKPKLETPFKCYIYATKPKKWFRFSSWGYASDENLWLSNGKVKMCDGFEFWANDCEYECLSGKVIGEFVCDKIVELESEFWDDETYESIGVVRYDEDREEKEKSIFATNGEENWLCRKACLKWEELRKYIGQDINTFYALHISQLKIYSKPKELSEFSTYAPEYTVKDGSKYSRVIVNPLKRPFQSWGYVESLGE